MVLSWEWNDRGRLESGRIRPLILAAVALAAISLLLVLNTARPAPAPAVTFISLKGEAIATSALRGKVAVVNFWATDCPVCVREMPGLISTFEAFHGRGLELIAVAMRHDPPNYVIQYVEKSRLPFQVALDPVGEHARAFGEVQLTPTTFVIDKHGRIVLKMTGAIDFPRLHAVLQEKLAEPA